MGKLFFVAIAVILIVRLKAIRRARAHADRFEREDILGRYVAGTPIIQPGAGYESKAPHGVLLVHGYSAAPSEYRQLCTALQEKGCTVYAPRLDGFGLTEFDQLQAINPQDWLRNVVEAYDVLAQMAEKISVIGHSNGGALGLMLSQIRPVHKLVLAAPNVVESPYDRQKKSYVMHPVYGRILRWVYPWFEKPDRAGRISNTDTLEPRAATGVFHYAALPIRSLQALWNIQDEVQTITHIEPQVLLVGGAQDVSIDLPAIRDWLEQRDAKVTEQILEQTAHNVYEDWEQDQAISTTIDFVTDTDTQ